MSACSAYIVEVVECTERSAVVLRPPWGQRLVWMAEGRPDHQAARALREAHAKVFAVHVTPVGGDFECTVIVGSDDGPRTVQTSLEAGLALCQGGVHGVLRHLTHVQIADAGQLSSLQSAC